MKNNFTLIINYCKTSEKDRCPMINITDKETFDYSLIQDMYKKSINSSGHGHGIQVDNIKHKKTLLNMCDKISDIIIDTKKKLNKRRKHK